MIKAISEKLSQYDFLTNLLPGTMLCIMLRYMVGFNFEFSAEWYQLIVIFYFVGMVNNRVGSLLIEPMLRRLKIVKPTSYKSFILAEKKDEKIHTLMVENNVYRSCISMCLITLFAFGYRWLIEHVRFFEKNTSFILLIGLIILFVFSVHKQTRYINNRVEQVNKGVDRD